MPALGHVTCDIGNTAALVSASRDHEPAVALEQRRRHWGDRGRPALRVVESPGASARNRVAVAHEA